MKVWTTYRSLSAEQRQILKAKKVELDRPIDEILALLKPLAACDKLADKSRTKMGCSFGLGVVLTIVLAVVLSNVGWSALTLLVLVAFVAAVAFAGTMYFFMKSIDLSNNFRDFALPVLTVFREDFEATKPVHLRLNLDPPTASSKKTAESAPYKQGVYHKVIDTTYVDPWMTASALLVDGTKLSWEVTDEVRERKKTKRNPRGKYKTKTKYRKKTDIEVEVALRKKTYAMTAQSPGEVTSGDKRNKVRMEREVRSDSLDPLNPRVLIDVVADVYRNTRKPVKEAGA
ncbi:MAG TPA: hypothetical protein VFV49_18135 [Thermoanaerobaculia bacterium]|nr:hypothetical protein [Thermoanaerobaculia bacterium]